MKEKTKQDIIIIFLMGIWSIILGLTMQSQNRMLIGGCILYSMWLGYWGRGITIKKKENKSK